jgi:hypothetical protein
MLMLLGVEDAPTGKPVEPLPPGRSIGERKRFALAHRKTNRLEWGAVVDFSSGHPEFYKKGR